MFLMHSHANCITLAQHKLLTSYLVLITMAKKDMIYKCVGEDCFKL